MKKATSPINVNKVHGGKCVISTQLVVSPEEPHVSVLDTCSNGIIMHKQIKHTYGTLQKKLCTRFANIREWLTKALAEICKRK